MLICFYGTDMERARAEARARIEKDGRTPDRILANEWYAGRCTECANTMPLFGDPNLYVLDTPSDNEDYAKEVYASLGDFASSPHTFMLIEGALKAAEVKKLIKEAQEVFEYKKAAKADRFNTFALADALSARDKRMLWLKLRAAYEAGESAEAIIGVLMWQLKTLALAGRTKTASEADMKDFPYNKAKRALRNFKEGEVETLLRSLTVVYHEGHGGVRNIDDGLEAWVLNI